MCMPIQLQKTKFLLSQLQCMARLYSYTVNGETLRALGSDV